MSEGAQPVHLDVACHAASASALDVARVERDPAPAASCSSDAQAGGSEDGRSSGADADEGFPDLLLARRLGEDADGDGSEARAPDGGWGWIVVAAAFVTNLIADGVTFTFGIVYVDLLKYFKEGKSKTAWIGGLFMAMPLLSGPIASYLTDRFGCRRVCIFGAVLSAVGFIISSFAHSIELLIVTFGIVSGFGLALCYVAAVVIVAYYFDKRRSLATGLSVCGSGIGTFVFAPLTASLITEYGWRGTTLILAGLFLNIAVCGALMRDLKWTKAKSRALRKDRQRRLRQKRSGKSLRSAALSADCMGAQPPAPAAAAAPPAPAAAAAAPVGSAAAAAAAAVAAAAGGSCSSARELRRLLQRGDAAPGYVVNKAPPQQNSIPVNSYNDEVNRHFNSVLNIPTYVCNGEKVPLEVLELLSANQSEYRVHLKKYANQQHHPSTSIQDNTNPNQILEGKEFSPKDKKWSPLVVIPHPSTQQNSSMLHRSECEKSSEQWPKNATKEEAFQWWVKKSHENNQYQQRRTTQYLRNLQVHRHSLIYRSAVLKIRRSRLRASSCPDIYRNSMTQTIHEEKDEWFSCLGDLRDVIADMVDFSHFTDVRFVLFAISNFLLYSWYDVPYVFITDKAIEMGYSEPDASFLISILGILNMLGVIVLGWAGDQSWVNAGVVYAICMAICGVVTGLVPLLSSYTGLCIVAGGFGLSISANYSLASIILVELITLDRFTNAYGLLLLVQGIANLIGPPLAGWLYDISGDYDLSFYLAGFFIILCGILLIVLPAMKWINFCWNGQLKRKSTTPVRIHFSQNIFCTKENSLNSNSSKANNTRSSKTNINV
ncbi:hypothetical protein R5R35_003389 [Gryllus longicercus]|uniref:Major facilitator superfamily (MFS) profile domain-containing protein n=1 Tax=Gryllus longicercus TaxID=2509291 RepID=A0AAN9VXG1_9ORTH